MDGDVINRFRPIRKTRGEMRVSANKLFEVATVWSDVVDQVLHNTVSPCGDWKLPVGFGELTNLLVTFCDDLSRGIDPTAFTDCRLYAQKLEAGDAAAFQSLCDSKVRAVAAGNRMMRCVMDQEDAARASKPDAKGSGTEKRRNTTPGTAAEKILAALRKHHKYRDGGCENWEPIGGNELAGLAPCSSGAVSNFWKRKFKRGHGSYSDYQRACEQNTINVLLALWSGESPAAALELIEDVRQRGDR